MLPANHLYTLNLGSRTTDYLEKTFFGKIDNEGSEAVAFFSEYKFCDRAHDMMQPLLRYVDAQKWRTPKGLDFLRWLSNRSSQQDTLLLLRHYFQMHCTIWMECVWEVLGCDDARTKFIVSDHPVTTYNRGVFPGSDWGLYPKDAPIEFVGTHTIFPLNLTRCLVLTNLGYVRDPWTDPVRSRANARYFDNAVFDLRRIQTRRQIDEVYVLAINQVIKSRARRYIAAAREEWLHPESSLGRVMWNKLGGKYFLMPDPRKIDFHTETLFGFKDGRAWGTDEYGRRHAREGDPEVRRLRDREWRTFQRAKQSWDSSLGKLSDRELRMAWDDFDRDES